MLVPPLLTAPTLELSEVGLVLEAEPTVAAVPVLVCLAERPRLICTVTMMQVEKRAGGGEGGGTSQRGEGSRKKVQTCKDPESFFIIIIEIFFLLFDPQMLANQSR